MGGVHRSRHTAGRNATTIELPSSHLSLISHSKAITDLILEAVGHPPSLRRRFITKLTFNCGSAVRIAWLT